MTERVGDETIRETARPPPQDGLVGSIVDQYRIESLVGAGATGLVYRGVHLVINKTVAIKVLKSDYADDAEMVHRLVREARTVNAIRHPGIVDVFDFGTLPRTHQPYIVMDLLEGESLEAFVLREAPVPLDVAAPMLDELLSALHAAHQVGVVHRDLKPGNIFLERQPEHGVRLKIIDFGLARQAERAHGSIRPTTPGSLIGTPAFMAPEQVRGEKLLPATDLYAVGGIAYQLLTGHMPYEGATAIEVLTQKLAKDPRHPQLWVPSLDTEIDLWVMALLHRDVAARTGDASEARRQLRHIVEGTRRKPQVAMPPDWGHAQTLLSTRAPPHSPSDGSGARTELLTPVPQDIRLPQRRAPTGASASDATLRFESQPDIRPSEPQDDVAPPSGSDSMLTLIAPSRAPLVLVLLGTAGALFFALWLLFQK